MNKSQRAIFSVAVAVIAILIGFEVIVGPYVFHSARRNSQYYELHGFSWVFLIFIIGSYEFWLWGRPEGESHLTSIKKNKKSFLFIVGMFVLFLLFNC
jgi:hypothetical protein